MTEIKLLQRSGEWFQFRRSLLLTASRFGDAIGLGMGRPYDFLVSLISDDPVYDPGDVTSEIMHGLDLELVIDEAYQILTGHVTQKSGLWIPDEDNSLHGISGASPDAKVYNVRDPNRIIGLAEYKSPVYKPYSEERHPPHGIPRRYMAQIQGQMAISKQPWCDFMAVCAKSRDIMLRRVYFNNVYWSSIAVAIKHFCDLLQVMKSRTLSSRTAALLLSDRFMPNLSQSVLNTR